jgi:predicted MFS family arabinose efflux permease
LSFVTSATSRAWATEEQQASKAGALGDSRLRLLVVMCVPLGAAFGVLNVAIPAFTDAKGSAGAAGFALAIMGVASLAAGAWYGAQPFETPPMRRLLTLTMLFALGSAPLAVASSIPMLLLLLPLAGASLGAVTITLYELLDEVAPRESATEALTWLTTAHALGAAGGSALTGLVAESASPGAALALAPLAAIGVMLVAAIQRRPGPVAAPRGEVPAP